MNPIIRYMLLCDYVGSMRTTRRAFTSNAC